MVLGSLTQRDSLLGSTALLHNREAADDWLDFKIAGNFANKQLNELVMVKGFFLHGLSDTRIFNYHDARIGGILMIFHSNDDVSVAEKQAGLDYVRSIIKLVCKVSAFGPWFLMSSFTVTRDIAACSVTMTAGTMIKKGVAESTPNELLVSYTIPSFHEPLPYAIPCSARLHFSSLRGGATARLHPLQPAGGGVQGRIAVAMHLPEWG